MDNLIEKKYKLFKNNKINALQLIGEVYDEENLCNYYRDYIMNHCSDASIKKMIINSYDKMADSLVSASLI